MKILDFHVHFFPEKLFGAIWDWFDKNGWQVEHKIQAEEVSQRLQSLGVEKMVLLNYAHKAGMSTSLNKWTHEFVKTHPEIIPFGTVHPHDEDCKKELDRCFQEYHFHGIKLHTHVMAIAADDPCLFPIYEKMEESQKILLMHAGIGPSFGGYAETTKNVAGAHRVKTVLKQFPKLKLVIPHLGGDEYDAFFDLMEEFPNLWMDTAMVLADYFPRPNLKRVEALSDRILYGSDAPNLPFDFDVEIKNIKEWFSPDIQEKLFWINAHRLLEL
jgi:uncharacterized protein